MEHSCIGIEMATLDQETLLSQKERRENPRIIQLHEYGFPDNPYTMLLCANSILALKLPKNKQPKEWKMVAVDPSF